MTVLQMIETDLSKAKVDFDRLMREDLQCSTGRCPGRSRRSRTGRRARRRSRPSRDSGALLCLADLALVLSLNLTYDIGLKLTTIHLILLTVFLLASYFRRLLNFLIFDRVTEAAAEPALFKTAGASRMAVAAQAFVGVYLLVTLA